MKYVLDLPPSIDSGDITLITNQDKGQMNAIVIYLKCVGHFHGSWHQRQNIIKMCVKFRTPHFGYKVISLTYQICFICLPIPVTGPEGPRMSLVLSWELGFYEISVASQKNMIFVFLEWFTFLVFYCLFHCFVTNIHISQEWDNDVWTSQ